MSISDHIVGLTDEFRIVKNLMRDAIKVAEERGQIIGDIHELVKELDGYMHNQESYEIWEKLMELSRLE